jgi:hypothetical protein
MWLMQLASPQSAKRAAIRSIASAAIVRFTDDVGCRSAFMLQECRTSRGFIAAAEIKTSRHFADRCAQKYPKTAPRACIVQKKSAVGRQNVT